MAIMIPDKPRTFSPASQEGLMFEALALLPDDYYVFHSFRITDVDKNILHESETDFVIYNQKLGVICLEAKAGQVRYSGGEWLYGSGQPMQNDGPFNQASANKFKLIKYISNSHYSDILKRCKFLHAVWFPSITDNQLSSMTMPSEAKKELVLTKEALLNPNEYLQRIFAIKVFSKGNEIITDISDYENGKLIRDIFCPEFNIIPTATYEADLKKMVFHRLLNEQANILNFLVEQKTAAINGAAGTGKTMIACAKASSHAKDGEKVLFLCFNAQLREFLQNNNPNDYITYNTIAGFACGICHSATPDYQRAKEKLEDMYLSGTFPYKHIIIDEGQDFGNDIIEEADIIKLLYDIIIDHEELGGTFYVFYDRLQLIQAKQMPQFIGDMDCKLTLYRNCRNTENIAVTSLKPITERRPKLYAGAVKGVPAKLHYCDSESDEVGRIDSVINRLLADGYKDIVILTCKTENASVLSSLAVNGKYRNKYKFTTCRKFKGLEADAVILIDVDRETFSEEQVLIYYVGASRARLRLDVMVDLTDDECIDILKETLHYAGKIRKPKKDLATALNALGSLNN